MLRRKTLADQALRWEPDDDDIDGPARKSFLRYMVTNCCGLQNAKKIDDICSDLHFTDKYHRNGFQHHILIPFKKEGQFFIGSAHNGIYFINSPDDAKYAAQFYLDRIRQEQRHLRQLRSVITRNRLFEETAASERNTELTIYLDESGTPDRKAVETDPFFIVTAIVVSDRRAAKEFRSHLELIRRILGREPGSELKSTSLYRKQQAIVLKQLSLLDFEFGSVCFLKEKLTGEGFQFPKVFYKYAYRFLITDILTYTGETNIVFDEYGGKNSAFQQEFFAYLRKQTTGYPVGTIQQMEMFRSDTESLIQLADLICGAVKGKVKGQFDFLPYIMDKAIKIEYFPPMNSDYGV